MPAPAPQNQYPGNPNAFQNEQPMQFLDGQRAAVFKTPGDVVAWNDPSRPDTNLYPLSGAEALIRTENSGLYFLKAGILYDVRASEAANGIMQQRVDQRIGLPDATIGQPWQITGTNGLNVTRVMLRQGGVGAPQEPGRGKFGSDNTFDIVAAKLANLSSGSTTSQRPPAPARERERAPSNTSNTSQARAKQEAARRIELAAAEKARRLQAAQLTRDLLERQRQASSRAPSRSRDRFR